MVQKAASKKAKKKPAGTKPSKSAQSASRPLRGKKAATEQNDDISIVIMDDDIQIDQEKINEERRAYLEEARSQDAFD